MDTFSIRDLRNRTDDLVRTAESGHLSVVTRHGRPVFVAVPFDDILLTNGVSVAMAIRLFQDQVVSLGRAARITGLPLEDFMTLLGTLQISVVDYNPAELDEELKPSDA